MIDARAVVDPAAKIDADVYIGPYAVIGADVEIGRGTRIETHAVIKGPTVIGVDNHIFQFASVGDDPQDKKYARRADAARRSAIATRSASAAR